MDKIDGVYKKEYENINNIFNARYKWIDKINLIGIFIFVIFVLVALVIFVNVIDFNPPESAVGIKVGSGGLFKASNFYYTDDYTLNSDGTLTINSYYYGTILGKVELVKKQIVTNQWVIEK
jgi:hypothetical protein